MAHIFSFFSGIGLLDLGFENEGFEIVFVNDNYSPFLDAYKFSRNKLNKNEPIYGYHLNDVKEFDSGALEKKLKGFVRTSKKKGQLVGFIGGPPCPDFSIGGKNLGKKGENGILSLHYIKIIGKHNPHFFLFENVKGLWRTKLHRLFYEELKNILKMYGYVLTEKLINTIEYSVPQDRERIILFGVKESLANELNIIYDKDLKFLVNGKFKWKKFADYPDDKAFDYNWQTISPFNPDSLLPQPNDIPISLTVEHWFRKNDVYNHPNSDHFFKPKAGLKKFLSIAEGDDTKKSYKRLHRWRYSPTAAYGNNEVHLHPYKARRLTVAEALAVQSVPKKFELPENMSLTNMFKSIGNGVPYLASKKLAKTIKEFLGES